MSFKHSPGNRKLYSKAQPKVKENPVQKRRALEAQQKKLDQEKEKLERELKELKEDSISSQSLIIY